MIGFFKKYWFLMLLAALAAILAFLWATRSQRPAQDAERGALPVVSRPSLPGSSISALTTVSINATVDKEAAKLLSVQRSTPFTDGEARKIARALGFAGDPLPSRDATLGTTYAWSQEPHFLKITPKTNQIGYGTDLIFFPYPKSGRLLDQGEAEEKIQELIGEIGLSLPSINLEKNFKTVSLFGQELVPAPESEADFVEIEYTASFEDWPLVGRASSFVVARAVFDKNGDLTEFGWTSPFRQIFPKEAYPLKSIAEVSKTIKSDAKIIHLSAADPFLPLNPADIRGITISSISLGYFVPDDGELIHPVFILEGTARLSRGSSEITLYLAAIKEDFLSP